MNDNSDIPTDILNIEIVISYDMGWQKHSTGRIYNSLSGHGFMIGCITENLVSVGVRAKKCKRCSYSNSKDVRVTPHICPVNHVGSSGSIEEKLALDLTVEMHTQSKRGVFVESIINDDDSTMRLLLKHPKNNSKYKLEETIPQPAFLADPSHFIEVISKPFFNGY